VYGSFNVPTPESDGDAGAVTYTSMAEYQRRTNSRAQIGCIINNFLPCEQNGAPASLSRSVPIGSLRVW
jgi:hypothetical protein